MNECIAVVIGTGSYNDLGMIRSCGECGMSVIYVTDEKHIIPIHRSRYLSHTYFIPIEESSLIEVIEQIVKENPKNKVIIYPTSDITAYYLDHNYSQLRKICYFSNAKGQLKTLMDKFEMNKLAQSCGLEVPSMINVDLSEMPIIDCQNISYPCIVKPLRSIGGDKCDITKCSNWEELNNTFEKYRKKGNNEVLIQQFVDGNNQHEIAVTGVALPCGDSIICGEIQKIRIRGNGSTVFGIYKPDNSQEKYLRIKEFIKKSGYQGIFDIEFLKNDDGLYFIECNFRNGAYGYAVTYAGFNMPDVYQKACLNQEIKLTSLKKIVFMEERSDFLNVLDGSISLWHWLRDVFSTNVFLFWNRKDIKPLLRVPYFIKKYFK